MWLTKQHHTQEQELPYISRVCPNWSRVFLRQPQAGSLGGHPVPLLPALSPPSSLCRSALSPVKALPGVLLHLGCACRQVPSPQSHRSTVFGFVSHHHRSFHPLYFRLAHLLQHDFVLKPQYDFVAGDAADVWLSCTHVTAALNDPSLMEASCPLSMRVKAFLLFSVLIELTHLNLILHDGKYLRFTATV